MRIHTYIRSITPRTVGHGILHDLIPVLMIHALETVKPGRHNYIRGHYLQYDLDNPSMVDHRSLE